MESLVTSVVDFVSAHRQWAPAIVFALALAETLAFLSLLIPSTAILVAVGALVAAGALDFMPLFVAAAAGSVLGSTLSWWLGRHYGRVVMRRWPLNRDPRLLERSEAAFERWGGLTVLAGHFVGPLRSVAFVAAGIAAMPAVAFQAANLPGAIVWAFVVPKSGEIGGGLLGAAWQALFGA
jgi:membrane protein DedA with SNARE-associated domain